jgi:hypothetical protein
MERLVDDSPVDEDVAATLDHEPDARCSDTTYHPTGGSSPPSWVNSIADVAVTDGAEIVVGRGDRE